MRDPSHNSSAQVLGQWYKPNWRQIHLSKGGHPTIHCGGVRLESVAPWQMPLHPDGQPCQGHSPELEREVSMTMEVRELLSQAKLDMSGQASGNLTPKRPNPMVVLTPPPHKLRDPSGPVDTSSQMSTLHDAELAEASLEEILTATSPTAKTPGPSGSAPLTDASYLQEEANKALGELLATKSSINPCQQKLVWELGMRLR